jgi:hypothetical protein
MSIFWKKVLVVLLPMLLVFFLYRSIFLGTKIAFPSNYLAHLYAPWSTTKFPGWETGIPNKPIGLDQVRFFYPLRTFINSEISHGRIPLWNPHVFSGYPQLANLQSAIFYPLNLVYLIFPQIVAWSLLVVIQPVLGTLFTYLYLRSLTIKYFPALFGGLVFGFSGYMTVWSQENAVVGHVAIWLPLMLFSIERVLKGKLRYITLLATSTAFSIFAGHFQTFFYEFILLLTYVFFSLAYRSSRKIKDSLLIFGGIFLGILIGMIQILPTLEIVQQSVRSITTAQSLLNTYLIPLPHLIHLIAPDATGNPGAYNFFGRGNYHETLFYVGIPALILATFSIMKFLKNWPTRFFTMVFIMSIVLASDFKFVRWIYENVPIINTFLPTRIYYLSTFSITVLSSIGLNNFLGSDRKKKYMVVGLLTSLTLIGILVVQYVIYGQENHLSNVEIAKVVGRRNLFLPALSIFLTALSLFFIKKTRLFLGAILAITLFNLLYFFNKYEAIGERQFLYPKNPVFSYIKNSESHSSRFISIGDPSINEDISSQEALYSSEGLDPLFPVRYAELVAAVKNHGQIPNDMSRVEATFHEISPEESMTKNTYRLKLMQIAGISTVVYYQGEQSERELLNRFPPNLFSKNWQDNGWVGFQYNQSLPRPYLVSDYKVATSPQDILNKLFSKENDPSKTVILEEDPYVDTSLEKPTIKNLSQIRLDSYSPQEVTISTETSSPSLLVLSDNYFPGWQATVDGRATKIYRANFTFRAVSVPVGRHKIVFSYYPVMFYCGGFLSLVGLAMLALTYVILKKNYH